MERIENYKLGHNVKLVKLLLKMLSVELDFSLRQTKNELKITQN